MARPSDVEDGELRELLEAAESALEAADYNACARLSMEAYTLLIDRWPAAIVHPTDTSGTAPSFERVLSRLGPRPWPDLTGVDLVWERPHKPYLRAAKTRFTFSDAATMLEYTLDTAIRAQRG